MLIPIAWQSLRSRRASAGLTLLSIALAMALVLGVEKLREQTRYSFTQTISGTDLIVGPRTGSLNLLLYSVFHIGHASNNMSWQSFQNISQHPEVKWAIPLSLGDSHKGFAVLGTNQDYFRHYRYAAHQPLKLEVGQAFADTFEVVLGAQVAAALNYSLGDQLVLAHGTGKVSLHQHKDQPFTVVGILAPTGTPVDQTLHIPLAGMQALHANWRHGIPSSQPSSSPADLTPSHITAMAVGLHKRVATFALQREINQYRHEPLLAILPGIALQELWQLMGTAEQALRIISAAVMLMGLLGMLTAIVSSLNERRREMAILRAVGARPRHIAWLLILEALLLSSIGAVLGLLLFYLGQWLASPYLQSHYGLTLSISAPSTISWQILGAVPCAAVILAIWPAWRAYRYSLVDGLTVKH